MGDTDTPKQFLNLGDRPILIHTIEKFVIMDEIDEVIVLTPQNFINHTKHLIEEYIPNNDKIVVIEGGKTRNDTLKNSIDYIYENHSVDDDSIIITHDSVILSPPVGIDIVIVDVPQDFCGNDLSLRDYVNTIEVAHADTLLALHESYEFLEELGSERSCLLVEVLFNDSKLGIEFCLCALAVSFLRNLCVQRCLDDGTAE